MAAKKKLPKGFACGACGHWHDFPPYVYAHWDEPLRKGCENCGRVNVVQEGEASPVPVDGESSDSDS